MVLAWRGEECVLLARSGSEVLCRAFGQRRPLSDEEQASEGRRGRRGTRAVQGWGGQQENGTAGGVTRATSKTHRAQTRWARWESSRLRDPQTHGLLCYYQPPASKSEHIITHTAVWKRAQTHMQARPQSLRGHGKDSQTQISIQTSPHYWANKQS